MPGVEFDGSGLGFVFMMRALCGFSGAKEAVLQSLASDPPGLYEDADRIEH